MFDGFGPDEKDSNPLIIPVLPKEASIVRNSYKQADSWSITFDADDFPIDPALVRAGAAEVFMFGVENVSDDQRLINRQYTGIERSPEAEDPMEEVLRTAGAKAAKDRFTFGNKPQVAGLFDEHGMDLDSSGRWVTVQGQDYTNLLASEQYPPTSKGRARRIPTGKRIDVILQQLLTEADQTGRLKLVVENIEVGNLPKVGGREVRANKRGIPVEQDTTYWDVMHKVASRYGMILFVRGLEVVLTRPQNLGVEYAHRIKRLAWGRNLASLELTRKMGKEQVPAIVIQAYDEEKKRTISVDYPRGSFTKVKTKFKTSKVKQKKSVNIRKTDEYKIIPVYGITDRKVLLDMAKTMHTILGRAERVVRFSTMDLKDLQSKDLLDLAAGDAVTVDFEEFNINRAMLANEKVTVEAKFSHLLARGFGEAVARVIAEKYRELQSLKRPLRVREATYDWSADGGISIEAELVDYIVIDGIREGTQKDARKSKRKNLKKDGTPVGQTVSEAAAFVRQHGGT